MDDFKIKEKLQKDIKNCKVYYENEEFQRMFNLGDWVVLGYSRSSSDEQRPSVPDGRNIQFMWAIRLVNMPFDFKDITHRNQYIILYDDFRSSNILRLETNASLSNAQHWFRPITTFEKLAIINLYNNKLL